MTSPATASTATPPPSTNALPVLDHWNGENDGDGVLEPDGCADAGGWAAAA
jgi:hypothetical protein